MPQSATLEATAPAPIMLPQQGQELESLLAAVSGEELRRMVRELSDELTWALSTFAPSHRLAETNADGTAEASVVLYKAAPLTDDMHGTQVTRYQEHAFAAAHRQDVVPFAADRMTKILVRA